MIQTCQNSFHAAKIHRIFDDGGTAITCFFLVGKSRGRFGFKGPRRAKDLPFVFDLFAKELPKTGPVRRLCQHMQEGYGFGNMKIFDKVGSGSSLRKFRDGKQVQKWLDDVDRMQAKMELVECLDQ